MKKKSLSLDDEKFPAERRMPSNNRPELWTHSGENVSVSQVYDVFSTALNKVVYIVLPLAVSRAVDTRTARLPRNNERRCNVEFNKLISFVF
jgi:hypothetical protein